MKLRYSLMLGALLILAGTSVKTNWIYLKKVYWIFHLL